ncbi:hypothetical protein [Hymenobacter volaticus]|uniref:Uncharacterized protein n=1 Tax=Hymenobacter volaticus TaxID=2932254 RepID=A0ABY4GFM1_9BACT|nr:hypothetical protein [Hymenobacter volaticus]UOQ69745.1 hypothetical protein MUN86_29990 [Hymenobacter volaticus]
MPNNLLFSCLLAVSGLLMGCRKSAPEPAARYSHLHTFNTVLGVVPPEKEQAEQPASQLRGSAQLTATALELTVAADPEEQLVLSIPATNSKAASSVSINCATRRCLARG